MNVENSNNSCKNSGLHFTFYFVSNVEHLYLICHETVSQFTKMKMMIHMAKITTLGADSFLMEKLHQE